MVYSNIPSFPRKTLAAAILCLGLCGQAALRPPASILPPAQPTTIQQTEESFGGIGVSVASLSPETGELTVIKPLDGSPAQQAGLQPGDRLQKIDGRDTRELSTTQAVLMLRGQEGTVVRIEVYRPQTQECLSMEITRALIHIPKDYR